MTSESIKQMKKSMIKNATKGFSLNQIKTIITELLGIDSEITNEFKEWLLQKATELNKK